MNHDDDDISTLLVENLARLLTESVTPERTRELEADGAMDSALWEQLAELGYPLLLLPEGLGGIGGDMAMASAVLREIAAHSAPLACAAESLLLLPWLATQAGQALPGDGPWSLALPVFGVPGDPAELAPVPGGRHAAQIALLASDEQGLVLRWYADDAVSLANAHNLAGEARDGLQIRAEPFQEWPLPGNVSLAVVQRIAALGRAAQMAGALQQALDLSVSYTGERSQFGRTLNRFQAIQQQLALAAAEVVAVKVLVNKAAQAMDRNGPSNGAVGNLCAAAKVRAGQAVREVARISHQVHGAMGFTQEYPLQLATRRLWSWRDEYGDETFWAEQVGAQALAGGGQGLWPMITAA